MRSDNFTFSQEIPDISGNQDLARMFLETMDSRAKNFS
jgi:hypothetical protein